MAALPDKPARPDLCGGRPATDAPTRTLTGRYSGNRRMRRLPKKADLIDEGRFTERRRRAIPNVARQRRTGWARVVVFLLGIGAVDPTYGRLGSLRPVHHLATKALPLVGSRKVDRDRVVGGAPYAAGVHAQRGASSDERGINLRQCA